MKLTSIPGTTGIPILIASAHGADGPDSSAYRRPDMSNSS